jgi:uncharacterized membrane protein
MRASRFFMESGRLEAFSDGVIAVIITIMVLELRAPQGTDLASLGALLPTFAAYALSFIFVGIHWNNHHHLLRAASGIDGRSMWANLHLLFWLSLAPFATSWLARYPMAAVPTAFYGFGLLMDAIAFTLLQNALIAAAGPDAPLARALRWDGKGKLSLALYVCGIGAAFVFPPLSDALYIVVAIIWFVPDRRFEAAMGERG